MGNDSNNPNSSSGSWVTRLGIAGGLMSTAALVSAFFAEEQAKSSGRIPNFSGKLVTDDGVVEVIPDTFPSVKQLMAALLDSGTIDWEHIKETLAVEKLIVSQSQVYQRIGFETGRLAIYIPDGLSDTTQARAAKTQRLEAAEYVMYENLLKKARPLYLASDKGKQFIQDLRTKPVAAALTVMDSIEEVLKNPKLTGVHEQEVHFFHALKAKLKELPEDAALDDIAAIQIISEAAPYPADLLNFFGRSIGRFGRSFGTGRPLLEKANESKETGHPQLEVEFFLPVLKQALLPSKPLQPLGNNKSVAGVDRG